MKLGPNTISRFWKLPRKRECEVRVTSLMRCGEQWFAASICTLADDKHYVGHATLMARACDAAMRQMEGRT